MRDKILVVGGYGKIGSVITQQLVGWFPNKVLIGGKNLIKAKKLANELNNEAVAIYIDLNEKIGSSIIFQNLANVKLVILTFDLSSTWFLKYCLSQGIDFIDISPSYQIIQQTKKFHQLAVNGKSTGLISVGLSPGLSNLIVKEMQNQMIKLDSIEIMAKLGSGKTTGFRSFQWSFSNINSLLNFHENGYLREAKSFDEHIRYKFSDDKTSRKIYRFNFPEQQTIPITLNIPTFSNWLCYESSLGTNLISKLKWVFKSNKITRLIAKYYALKASGDDIFQAEIIGKSTNQLKNLTYVIKGTDQGNITAGITSLIAKELFENNYKSGVYHIEELFNLSDLDNIFEMFDITLRIL